MITDGTVLYAAINALHGGGNPTTFARITLIHSTFLRLQLLSLIVLLLRFVLFKPNPTMYRSHGSCRKGRAQRVPSTADV
jgi:hypothetical protein